MRKTKIVTWDGEVTILTEAQGQQISDMMAAGKSWAQLPNKEQLIFSNIKSFDFVSSPEDPAVMDLPALPPPLNVEELPTSNAQQERWKKILTLNSKRIKDKKGPNERPGLLKNFEDLDHYETTGEWPEYVHPSEWRSPRARSAGEVAVAGRFPNSVVAEWVKKRVTRKEWDRDYAPLGQYYKLTEDGSDIWVAFTRVKTNKPMPDHMITCEPTESDRLERMIATK
jgi:hypothetical protein